MKQIHYRKKLCQIHFDYNYIRFSCQSVSIAKTTNHRNNFDISNSLPINTQSARYFNEAIFIPIIHTFDDLLWSSRYDYYCWLCLSNHPYKIGAHIIFVVCKWGIKPVFIWVSQNENGSLSMFVCVLHNVKINKVRHRNKIVMLIPFIWETFRCCNAVFTFWGFLINLNAFTVYISWHETFIQMKSVWQNYAHFRCTILFWHLMILKIHKRTGFLVNARDSITVKVNKLHIV